MKHMFLILISTIVLQGGCFTAIAGFNDGSSSNNIFHKIANANKPEKTEEEKLQEAQNKELRSCLAGGEYRFKCADEIMLKECDVSLFKQATLYLKCEINGEYETNTST